MKNFLENLKTENNLKLLKKLKQHFDVLNDGKFMFHKFGKDFCFKQKITTTEDEIVNAVGFDLLIKEMVDFNNKNQLEEDDDLTLDDYKNKLKSILNNFRNSLKIEKNNSNFLVAFYFFIKLIKSNENTKNVKDFQNLTEEELDNFIQNYLKNEITLRMHLPLITTDDKNNVSGISNKNIEFSLNLITTSGSGRASIKASDFASFFNMANKEMRKFTFEDKIEIFKN